MKDIEQVYIVYFKDVYYYIKSISHSDEIAEEITAETFFKAMKSLNEYKGEADIRVWLCQIAKNTYYTYLKKNKKYISMEEFPHPASNVQLEKNVLDKIITEKIHQYLHELDDPYKKVFTLRVFAGLSFKQIAKLFNKTENWACVTYHRSRMKIKNKMEEYL